MDNSKKKIISKRTKSRLEHKFSFTNYIKFIFGTQKSKKYFLIQNKFFFYINYQKFSAIDKKNFFLHGTHSK